ncbi:hypothetical protein IW138_005836 [Coemansia sp. RSA 986]|nr:hypothetical protein IW138_005836 [Coemansia sp. RSA 986]
MLFRYFKICFFAAALLPLTLASPAAALATGTIAPSPLARDASGSSGLGNAATIVCQLNRDRKSRYELPVFVHQTLSQAAEILGTRYAGGTFNNTLFDDIYRNLIQPLGDSVSSSYKILGTFTSDQDYVRAIERAIYSSLFARNLQAVGLFERKGVYTVVMASGLSSLPRSVDPCPASPAPVYQPPTSDPDKALNGIELPSFLCAINGKRSDADANSFAVHEALENEAVEQAKQMVRLGRYTVDGPRKVDQSIYAENVAVKKLYWFAGDRYTGARSLVDLLMASYADTVLDPSYSVIGVAQKNGYWSVILAELYRTPSVEFSCPLSLDEVSFTS